MEVFLIHHQGCHHSSCVFRTCSMKVGTELDMPNSLYVCYMQ